MGLYEGFYKDLIRTYIKDLITVMLRIYSKIQSGFYKDVLRIRQGIHMGSYERPK